MAGSMAAYRQTWCWSWDCFILQAAGNQLRVTLCSILSIGSFKTRPHCDTLPMRLWDYKIVGPITFKVPQSDLWGFDFLVPLKGCALIASILWFVILIFSWPGSVLWHSCGELQFAVSHVALKAATKTAQHFVAMILYMVCCMFLPPCSGVHCQACAGSERSPLWATPF